jgi:uncharacterized membrane protein
MPDLGERLWNLLGAMHPMLVHFPIGLLIAGAIFEFVRLRGRAPDPCRPAPAAVACLILGAVCAGLAAASGWGKATVAAGGPPLEVHRWVGVAAAVVGILAAVMAVVAKSKPGPRMLAWYRLVVAAGAIGVGAAGHFGGELVWGRGYLAKALKQAAGYVDEKPNSEPEPEMLTTVPTPGANVDFVKDVFPILSRHCYTCHSGTEQKSDFALDSREGLLKGGDSGEPGMIPGKGAASLIVQLVKGEDPTREMPPRGDKLTKAQIETLTRWIDEGAVWGGTGGNASPSGGGSAGGHWHWAYSPPMASEPPKVSRGSWSKGVIDRHVLAKLESEGLGPSPEADRATLIRRLSLDLTGIPPTPEEVDAFGNDTRADAYERLVDRLLASPRYGERWARVWLDLARYADTHGYEKDGRRVMWPYRDWVIRAYNDDMPFDRFTVEQLAGDMLPAASISQLVATGFNRNTPINEEGGTDPEEFRVEAVLDRVNTVSSVWMGMTLACAQCHDHKYDPLPQKDYFRFYAFFNQDESDVVVLNKTATEKRAAGPMVDVPRAENLAEFERVAAESARARADLQDQGRRLLGDGSWEGMLRERREVGWTTLPIEGGTGTGGVTLRARNDAKAGVLEASGQNPETSTYTLECRPGWTNTLTGVRLEAIVEPGMPGAGRSGHGNFVVSEIKVEILGTDGKVRAAEPDAASATFWHAEEGDEWSPTLAIDGRESGSKGWSVHPKHGETQELVVRFRSGVSVATTDIIRVTIAQNYGQNHALGRFRLSVTGKKEFTLSPPAFIAEVLAKPAAERSETETARLHAYVLGTHPSLAEARGKSLGLERRLAELTVARTFVMGRAKTSRESRVFDRGSFLSLGEVVSPEVPGVLVPTAGEAPSADRLGLSRWLIDPKNPLTARVQVNRVWAVLFGRGLVETEEDFGTQGEPPTHPALLDHLALRFVELKWSQKALLREIVLSATYRQRSHVTTEMLERDPENKLLARGPRFRVEAEMIRDIALAASGLLSPKMYGESVFPPQPAGIWTMIYSSDQWTESTGEDRYRRGIYTFARRTAPYPTFGGFDAPSREVSCTRRPRTNTPLQALTTMNDPQFVEAAGALGVRMLREGSTTGTRAERGLRLVLGRVPEKDEVERLVRLVGEQSAAFAKDPAAAEALAAQIPGRPQDLSATDLATWTVVGNVILNLDEAITKE